MLDYIVVGLGLAGITFSEVLEKNGKTFKVISDGSQQASQVAGGLYNPVILKRFTMAWNARNQLETAKPFYQSLEEKLSVKLDYELPVLRKFASIEEQNSWFEAADRPDLDYFLSARIIQNNNAAIDAPYGFGEVKYTGRIDTGALVDSYRSYLIGKEQFASESFDFDALSISDGYVTYKDITAKHIVFACGYGLKQNPYFEYLPLNGTKGELLIIHAPEYKEENVVKSSVFTIPMENDKYLVGATYKWKDKSNEPTEESKNELLEKLKTLLRCDFNVVDHVAGIRPTVVDRRPLLGKHPKYQNLYVLNGFGSRGVMIGPYASTQLFDHIEYQKELDPEMDIQRFTKKYFRD
ncbi:MAG: FAD-binding oxidoreductase [Bacteroidota bacterium]|uniref:FAD-binding oxidoreductase n=1 Tax=Flagellimonas okinawensis TaxID=3031324 RepID=A0ABT5XND6_9FLAO|nr:FAD-binding oxidoreductase [[Muricauda] okinawensis]MDF0707383.1 FAD-binding oxidoreductase [[Muricauda] okinawensis]MEC8832048.1 FAD-binding oxidoreductase [Bacteroidota bacterium]